jgi:hypothetical protein
MKTSPVVAGCLVNAILLLFTANPANGTEGKPGRTPTASTVVIPGTVQGIWVNAITGPGCNSAIAPEVYLLTPQQFADVKADKMSRSELKSVGKVPLLIPVSEPGEYCVGVQIKTDETCPQDADRITAYFADDDWDACALHEGIRVQEDRRGNVYVEMGLFKFYSVKVEAGKTTPVVGLFFRRGLPMEEYANFYPQQQFFSIRSDKGLRITGGENEVAFLKDLLRRGGKIPAGKDTHAVFVDRDGMVTGRGVKAP